MTLPNLINYKIRVTTLESPELTPNDMLQLVMYHPLTPLVRRIMHALATTNLADGQAFMFPTKRELAKLIAQSHAPKYSAITPTLVVVLALNLKLLRYVHEFGKRVRDSAARALASPLSEKSIESDEDAFDEDDSDHSTKKTKRSRLTRQSNEFMTAWFLAHKTNPYPTAKERADIAAVTQLSELQVRNWFANMRKRHWKPQQIEKKPRCLLDLVLRRNSNE